MYTLFANTFLKNVLRMQNASAGNRTRASRALQVCCWQARILPLNHRCFFESKLWEVIKINWLNPVWFAGSSQTRFLKVNEERPASNFSFIIAVEKIKQKSEQLDSNYNKLHCIALFCLLYYAYLNILFRNAFLELLHIWCHDSLWMLTLNVVYWSNLWFLVSQIKNLNWLEIIKLQSNYIYVLAMFCYNWYVCFFLLDCLVFVVGNRLLKTKNTLYRCDVRRN